MEHQRVKCRVHREQRARDEIELTLGQIPIVLLNVHVGTPPNAASSVKIHVIAKCASFYFV